MLEITELTKDIFNITKKNLIPFLKMINNNQFNKVTIILFSNSQTRCDIDYEPLNPEEQEKRLNYQGQYQNTEPLALAYEKIINDIDKFQEHSMFIYTNGVYKGQMPFEKFKSIQNEQRKQIRIIACSYGESNLSEFFKQEGYGTLSKQGIKPDQIGQIWTETLPISI